MNESLNPLHREGVESSMKGTTGREPTIEADYRIELARKAIHLFSLLIPIVYFFISRSEALTILFPLTAAFLIVDVARFYHHPTADWFYKTFGWLLRSKEQDTRKKRLNGATHVLLSATLCVLVFPKLITITAFSILIISDSVAALVGRKFGKHVFFKKTLEGSIAFFLSAIVVVLVAPKAEYTYGEYAIGVVASAVGAVIEALSIDVDDNLSIPLSIGITMWVLYALLNQPFEPSGISLSL